MPGVVDNIHSMLIIGSPIYIFFFDINCLCLWLALQCSLHVQITGGKTKYCDPIHQDEIKGEA